jgi:hypothetical protein
MEVEMKIAKVCKNGTQIISNLGSNLKQLWRLLTIPHNVLEKMKPGIYKYNNSCTMLSNIRYKAEAQELSMSLFGTKISVYNPFRTAFSRLYTKIVLSMNSKSEFTILLITSSGREYKLFDTENLLIMTIYKNKERLNKIVLNRKFWGENFRIIPFTVNNKEQIICEKLFDKEYCDSEIMFKHILNDYMYYFSRIKCDVNLDLDLMELNMFCQKIGKIKDFQLLTENLVGRKTCIVHGDLWRSNIINNGGKLYYLDFEAVGKRIFYYDLLYYIIHDFIVMNDSILLRNYMGGKYDSDFEKLFNIVGIQYCAEYKIIYLELICYFIYYEKWHNSNYEDNINKIIKTLKVAGEVVGEYE